MKKKTGFTLIELLAVIVILAIIALIATPLIMRTINDAKDGVLKSTLRNIIHVAETEYAKNLSTGTEVPNIKFEDLKYKGEKFDAGVLKYDKNGNAYIAVYKTNKCVYKGEGDTDVSIIKDITLDECMEKVNGGSDTSTEPIAGAADLIKKANDASITNYTDGNTGEMYTFTHEATEQTAATTDYRYIGSNPNNYITFNDETWRIIGVFDGKIKIIRNESIGNLAWNVVSNSNGPCSATCGGSTTNIWSQASLQKLLNGTSDEYTVTSETASNNWSLSETALSQVVENTWYLGRIDNYLSKKYCNSESYKDCTEEEWNNAKEDYLYDYLYGKDNYISASDIYSFEKVSLSVPSLWTGKVALMYPSDYYYTYAYGVNDICYSDVDNCTSIDLSSSGWLYSSADQWTLLAALPEIYNSNISAYAISGNGHLVKYYGVYNGSGSYAELLIVRPTVYLNSNIKLSGTGTVSDPYKIID